MAFQRRNLRVQWGWWAVAGALMPGLLIGGAMRSDASTPARTPEQIYTTNCGFCHGHNVGPIIKGRGLPPEMVTYMVRHGAGAMPAFKPTEVTPEELKALGVWIFKSKADQAERGK